MSRRKQKHLIDPKTAFGLFIAIGILWLLGQLLLSRDFLEGIGIVILLGGAAIITYAIVYHFQRLNSHRSLFQKAQTVVEQQINPLAIKRSQLVWQDAYGRPQIERWEKEKDHFISQLIEPLLSPNERKAFQREPTLIRELIEARVKAATQNQPAMPEIFDDMTPIGFEIFCAEELRRAGWNARVTRQGRDQGVDVVAEKGEVRVVVQCKFYIRPVGNKSVQEAAAARAHEQARYGIVVTNNTYTTAAKQLASTNGILLLHYSQLQNLHNLLGLAR